MQRNKRMPALVITIVLILSTLASGAAFAAAENNFVLNNQGRPMTFRAMQAELQISVAGAQLEQNGQTLSEDALVATGQILRLLREDGTVLSIQQIVVIGDVLGTGEAGIGQVTRIAQALTGEAPLNGIYAAAADISGSGAVDLTDLLLAVEQMRSLEAIQELEVSVEERPLYGLNDDPFEATMIDVGFIDGNTQVPYFPAETAVQIINTILTIRMPQPTWTDSGAEIVVAQMPNGSVAEFNFIDGTIFFSDYNLFFQPEYAGSILDLVSTRTTLIERLPNSFQRLGKRILIDVQGYDIDMFYKDGRGYVPAQTISDLFGTACSFPFLYNGEAFFMTYALDVYPDLSELCYSVPARDRSPELAEYTYNELCLLLDTQYGLKEQHNIERFNALFIETGLAEDLMSTDPTVADNALADLCYAYFADLHSAFTSPSPYAGLEADITPPTSYPSIAAATAELRKMEYALTAAYPNGPMLYEEVGDTAYVILPDFTWTSIGPDIDLDELMPNPLSTVETIMYAHQQITREDSPIENVVLDLSQNGGGEVDAAVFAMGWFLGGETQVSINDTFTEAQATTYYRVDVNADGLYDENDSIASKNRYCLIAAPSFSCGNLVPATLKASNQVTLLGKQTGGGACAVLHVTAADGTRFQISGPNRLSVVANGSFYDVDRGVTPDIPITRIEDFYDREALTEFIAGIYR